MHSSGLRLHHGKAPLVDPFTGENLEVHFDEQLPSLERAHTWNEWTKEELLLQLASHLCGRALIDADINKSYSQAIEALHVRLDPGSQTLAAQDFQ